MCRRSCSKPTPTPTKTRRKTPVLGEGPEHVAVAPLRFDCRKKQGSGGGDRSFRFSAGSAQPPMHRKCSGPARMRGLKGCNDLIIQVVTFLYNRRTGNEKVTFCFQLNVILFVCRTNLLSGLCKHRNVHSARLLTGGSRCTSVRPRRTMYIAGSVAASVRPPSRYSPARWTTAQRVFPYSTA